ncbi:uncharacterized protein LOC112879986 [Panicum hallii]|uniref:uncharacterized protein LOC112879986 n=1 Tax=Panicum hallii TaxID=206008 RepID=UPI000DF4E891|nr:uncharacterized protein LOC112879986 [Panicum hallii]
MEPNDAEETLSQALEYRNSLRRELNFDWSQDEEEEEGPGRGSGGGALGRDAQGPGRGSGGGALGRDAQWPGRGSGDGVLGSDAQGPGRGSGGGALGRDAQGPGRGSGGGALGRDAQGLGRGSGGGALGRDAPGQGHGRGAQGLRLGRAGAGATGDPARGRGKRPAQSSSSGAVRPVRGRGRPCTSQAYRPPRSTSVDVDHGSQPIDHGSQPIDVTDDNLHDTTQNSIMKEVCDKADWTFENTRVFCELCIQEIDAGNRANGVMTTRGYNNIAEKYRIAVGLHHSKVQLKNRLDFLKGLYSFWLQLLKDTGLGWNEALGTVVASEDYWNKATKGHPTWKQLRRGPPDHEDLLQEMFGGIVVDGSSACAPGEAVERNEDEGLAAGDQQGDDSDMYSTPPSTAHVPNRRSSLNRASGSSATSPLKQPKNQMVKVMQKIHATLENNCKIANKVMLGEHLEEKIKEVQSMAVRCGAREGSAEHFMATQLFKKPENRATFKAFETDEGRLLWLKRHCDNAGFV